MTLPFFTAPVLTKAHCHALWRCGALGNKLRAWRTVAEWRASGFAGLVVLRTLLGVGGSGSGPCVYNLRPDEVEAAAARLVAAGTPAAALMVNEAAPCGAALVQGEYLNGVYLDGFGIARVDTFTFSTRRAQMRDALRVAPRTVHGLAARLILRDAMTPSSHDDWLALLERYPDHVLEVSVYERCVGDLPGRNALVWEVRRY